MNKSPANWANQVLVTFWNIIIPQWMWERRNWTWTAQEEVLAVQIKWSTQMLFPLFVRSRKQSENFKKQRQWSRLVPCLNEKWKQCLQLFVRTPFSTCDLNHLRMNIISEITHYRYNEIIWYDASAIPLRIGKPERRSFWENNWCEYQRTKSVHHDTYRNYARNP